MQDHVFPAWAGMNRISRKPIRGSRSVPRVGGDEPMPSPRPDIRVGVFPAWAGMNRE